MPEKPDLEKMLKEIEVDERLDEERGKEHFSQEDIMRAVQRRREQRDKPR